MPTKSFKSTTKAIEEIESRITSHAKKYGPSQDWYYKSNLKMIGNLPAAVQRQISKDGFSFASLSSSEQKKIWSAIWQETQTFEVLTQALLFWEQYEKELTIADWKILKKWSNRIDNWAHSDSLSSYYAKLHARFPKEIYPIFKKWNSSKEPWLRRLSIVSLFYYSSSRKDRMPKPKEVVPLLEALLDDPHVYVQKGVGWTFRELFNAYPVLARKLLKKHIYRISGIAWQAATEKLPKNEKKVLLLLRKNRAKKKL